MITRLKQHNNHQTTMRRCVVGPHFAELRCLDCDTHIQWLGRKDFFALQMGTHINNTNNTITTTNNIIKSVPLETDDVKYHVLQTSFGKELAKGETPDSEGVVNSLEVAQ